MLVPFLSASPIYPRIALDMRLLRFMKCLLFEGGVPIQAFCKSVSVNTDFIPADHGSVSMLKYYPKDFGKIVIMSLIMKYLHLYGLINDFISEANVKSFDNFNQACNTGNIHAIMSFLSSLVEGNLIGYVSKEKFDICFIITYLY